MLQVTACTFEHDRNDAHATFQHLRRSISDSSVESNHQRRDIANAQLPALRGHQARISCIIPTLSRIPDLDLVDPHFKARVSLLRAFVKENRFHISDGEVETTLGEAGGDLATA